MNAFISSVPLKLSSSSQSSCFSPSKQANFSFRPSISRTSALRTTMLIETPLHLAENPAALRTIADAFNTLGLPEWLVEWGHPGLMGFMILGMGAPGAAIGWQGRLNENKREGVQQKRLHENIMVAFFLLAFLGGTGGTLSVAMQGHDVWNTLHFKSAVVVLILLGLNAVIAYSGFTIGNDGSPKGRVAGRKLHAYFGLAVLIALLVHGALGVKMLLE